MDSAKLQIEQQQKEAQHQFRNQVSQFALQIAGKVVKNQLDDQAAQTKLVNSLLDEIEKTN
jgi:F-type H+-transporting ATPase subunit b